MSRTSAYLAALIASLALAVACALLALQPASSANHVANLSPAPHQIDPSQAGYFLVTLHPTRLNALPGDIIGFIAEIRNRNGRALPNLNVTMRVEGDEDSLIYLDDSTFFTLHEDGPALPLQQLGSAPTAVTDTLEPNQDVRIEWKLQVSECALRDRWFNVIFTANAGQIEQQVYRRLYIGPHRSVYTGGVTADYRLNTTTPAPGDPVRHTVRIASTSFDPRLADVTVRLEKHDTTDRFLPTVAEDSSYVIFSPRDDRSAPLATPRLADQHVIMSGRSGLPGRLVPVDPAWSAPTGEFTLPRLNPGSVLVFSWTDYVAADAPIGTEVESRVAVSAGSATPTQFTTQLTVSPPRDDLTVDVYPADLRKLGAAYLHGDVVDLHMTITNHTTSDQHGLTAVLDLPFALSYVPASGSYSTRDSVAANARRLPDDWVFTGTSLPTLEPGQSITIAFQAQIGEDVVPQNNIEIRALLHQPNRQTRRATDRFRVVGTPDVSLTIADIGPVAAGDEVEYLVHVLNNGDIDLEDLRVGVEMACDVSYVPSSLLNLSGGVTVVGQGLYADESGSYSSDFDNEVRMYGTMAVGEERIFRLKYRIGDDVAAGTVVGPGFTATAKTAAGTTILARVMAREETEITVVEPLVTSAEFEARVEQLLGEIKKGATKTAENTDRILALAETAREINEEIKDITTATGATATELEETSSAIQANTDAIRATVSADEFETQVQEILGDIATNQVAIGEAQVSIAEATEAVGATAEQVRDKLFDEDPWGQSTQWILRVGGFAALASLIAGLVLPFSLWRGLVWVRRHPPRLEMSVPLWAIDLCRAGATLLATARRSVRDWLDRLRRR